ncbi:MAG: glycine cleavage system protein GcvH [Candidatus Sumerlaeaceae bacterium]|nr:glycine cleavage system protein GcvH [Candidatus Sumerlaeaceae bacterium]
MPSPSDVRFVKSHEWARREGGLVVVGISAYAVEQLNKEIVYVEPPQKGRTLKAGDVLGVVEAVKAASDIYAPVSGRVAESNEALAQNPSLVAEDPYGAGWIAKIEPSDPSEWENLLSPEDYDSFTASEEPH